MEKRDLSLLEITVKTHLSEDTIDLAKDLDLGLSVGDLNQAFCDQPAMYAFWATAAAQAKDLLDRKETQVKRQEDYLRKNLVGILDEDVRSQIEMDGGKATESRVERAIYAHPRYQAAQEELYNLQDEVMELRSQYSLLLAAKEAVNQRKDMLISLGAQYRAEGNNIDVYLKEKAAEVIRGSSTKGKK